MSGVFFADDGSATDVASVAAALAQSPIKVYFTDPRGAPQVTFKLTYIYLKVTHVQSMY